MATPKPKRPPKTIKEKKFVKAYLETGNATKAATIAYNANPSWANRLGHEVLSKLDMTSAFRKAGMTEEVMAQNTTQIALTATKVHGTTDDFIEIPDYTNRLNAMKFAAQLMGMTKQDETPGVHIGTYVQEQKNGYAFE